MEAALEAIELISLDDLISVIDPTSQALESAGQDSGRQVLASIGVADQPNIVSGTNDKVSTFAKKRSAELVGKRITSDGRIIDNPNARWTITEPTREFLRNTIKNSFEDGLGVKGLTRAIEEDYAFSHDRSLIIARTETIRAFGAGALIGFGEAKASGINLRKKWLTAIGACPICIANEEQGAIELEDQFSSGDDHPPGHPNCRCSLVPAVNRSV